MTKTVYTHTAQSLYDHDWTIEVFDEGVAIYIRHYCVPVRRSWEQINDPRILVEVFGFMHVTGFVILAQKLDELFQARNQL